MTVQEAREILDDCVANPSLVELVLYPKAIQAIRTVLAELDRLANLVANYQPIVDSARQILTAAKDTLGTDTFPNLHPDTDNAAEGLGVIMAAMKLESDRQVEEIERLAALYRQARAKIYSPVLHGNATDWDAETERNIKGE